MEQPRGWYVFGTHVDYDGPLEFSEERSNGDGFPLWERPTGTEAEIMLSRVKALYTEWALQEESYSNDTEHLLAELSGVLQGEYNPITHEWTHHEL